MHAIFRVLDKVLRRPVEIAAESGHGRLKTTGPGGMSAFDPKRNMLVAAPAPCVVYHASRGAPIAGNGGHRDNAVAVEIDSH